MEKVDVHQFQWVLGEIDYFDPFQSRVRPCHGMETVLVALLDDLWQRWDKAKCICPCSPWPLSGLQYHWPWCPSDSALWIRSGWHSIRLVLFLSIELGPVNVDWEWDVLPVTAIMWGARGFNTLSFIFNIYMKPLDIFIHCQGMRYHQYVHDSQLYIFITGELSDVAVVLSHCLEAVGCLDGGNNRLQMNLVKLWVFGPSELWTLSSLVPKSLMFSLFHNSLTVCGI